ncbi:hypothetical protein DAPPUDRAFT_325538 [Daphnia pulex]|uniref:Uncharacterized protein n=1 Tax=Daphnia pulex TaxID=6669 RepID=E9H521_DAPPU|nr:hypothetical protein DAPPUDRAFT_325538 [Daphnia pulex]|eukprot:EFX73257.1 hypothetical protein DAPPUDRAFT_325538 [Daphnia pulex]
MATSIFVVPMQLNKSYQQPNSDKDFKTPYLKEVWRYFCGFFNMDVVGVIG